ncbi:hypothetical protein V493_00671 [Pseudogymnoascus sp. VKM F-4281 (FW-2241)]|nr:hypothetical protein V493_00671 [Pseudogymnoascus sp. VKM F-4281 (FW-2241)]
MARTRQTARKSTSGPAPRRPLGRNYSYSFDHGILPLQHAVVVSKEPIVSSTPEAFEAATTSDAQIKVFSTPDILIIILSQLPHSSLLKAKLVNKTWASLFENVEIKASLFERPRPRGSAQYTEAYSDLLMNKLLAPWPTTNEEYANTHHSLQWRQLLICQPPVEALEIVQQTSQRIGGILEFRTIITCPDGLRMGFLYDVIRHWHQVERCNVTLLWNRKTGDVTDRMYYYPDGGPGYKTPDDKPCVTIWGKNSVGCGQNGGPTYNYRQNPLVRVIKSGEEEIRFRMPTPKHVSMSLESLHDPRDDEDGEDEDS